MRLTHWFTSSLLAAVSCAGYAQQTPSTKGPITLDVVVSQGKNEKPVAELPQSIFSVLDNGAAQPIQTFHAVSGDTQPVKVLIVIDAVNVDFQRLAYERGEIEKFLRANDGHLAQPTAIAIFTDTGTQVEPSYTTDGNALSQLLDKQGIGLRELRRSAGFYGAEERLDLSLKTTGDLLNRAGSENGRKFLIWLTPGWPLLSGPAVQLSGKEQDSIYQQVVRFSDALRQSRTTMYVVDPLGASEGPGRTFYYEEFVKGLRKPSQAEPGDLGAQVLAVQSGGQFLSGNNDLGLQLRRCYADASAFYELTYQPPPAENPNEYHRVEVRVAEHATARTTQGYYAQP